MPREWAAEYLTQHRVTRAVLSGTDENLAELKGQMPRSLADKVVGQISLDMNVFPPTRGSADTRWRSSRRGSRNLSSCRR